MKKITGWKIGTYIFWGSFMLWIPSIILAFTNVIPYTFVWIFLGGEWLGIALKMIYRKQEYNRRVAELMKDYK